MPLDFFDPRLKKALYSSAAMFANKFFQVFSSIITMPLLLEYLGENTFGLYISLQTFFLWLLFDNGISEAIKNELVSLSSTTNSTKIQSLVSTSFVLLLLFSSLLVLIFFFFYYYLFSHESISFFTLIITLSIIWVYIPIRIVREICTGLQKGYVYSNFLNVAAFLNLLAIIIGVKMELDINYFIIVNVLSFFLANLFCYIYVGLFISRFYVPKIISFKLKTAKVILPSSINFFLVGVFLMVINNIDLVFVNYLFGSEVTASFSFAFKLIVYAATFASFFSYPMWPAITESINERDNAWKKRAVNRLLLYSLIYTLFTALFLAVFGSKIIALWTSNILDIPFLLIFYLSLYLVIKVITNVIATILKAYGEIEKQIFPTFLEALLHICFCFLLAKYFGLNGYVLGMFFSALFGRTLYLITLFIQIEKRWKRD